MRSVCEFYLQEIETSLILKFPDSVAIGCLISLSQEWCLLDTFGLPLSLFICFPEVCFLILVSCLVVEKALETPRPSSFHPG